MEITEVKVRKVNNDDKVRAYVEIKIDDCLVIHGMRIIDGTNGLFVAMPSRKTNDGGHHDMVHPITQELRDQFTKVIIGEYNKIKDEDETEEDE